MAANINEYTREEVCVYKGRRYYVRDNGSIYRQCKEDGIVRKWDEKWTFGKTDPNTHYMLMGQERVHRIVCTAYHGEPIGDKNIVDHIDTNRSNNRPENLRWVTRMENILSNPITMAKVELICGSREAFIANPSLLFGHEPEDPNFMWMRNVSPEEAKASYESWKEWASRPIGERQSKGGSAGEWLYDRKRQKHIEETVHNPTRHDNIEQRNWKTPTEFPMCPAGMPDHPLEAYQQNMKIDEIFCRSHYGESFLKDVGYNPERDALIVLTHQPGGDKEWYLSRIYIEDGKFIHEAIRSCFEEIGGRKYFTIQTGGMWTDGEVLDDGC